LAGWAAQLVWWGEKAAVVAESIGRGKKSFDCRRL